VEAFKQAAEGKFSLSDSILVYNTFKSIVDRSKFSLPSNTDSEGDLYARLGTKITRYDLIFRMITESSNLATNMIIDQIGAKNVMKTMKNIGADDIRVLRGVEDTKAFRKGLNNQVTAYDLMLIFERIAKGTMVNESASNKMIEILKEQKFNSVIPAQLPKDVQVAHKTGSIAGIFHDSGIVYLPNGRAYVLVLLSADVKDDVVKKTLADVSLQFYNYVAEK
jgi:beta-lactamase class A